MSKIGLVIQREYLNRVRKRAFVILTVLIPILIVGLLFLAMWLGIEKKEAVKPQPPKQPVPPSRSTKCIREKINATRRRQPKRWKWWQI